MIKVFEALRAIAAVMAVVTALGMAHPAGAEPLRVTVDKSELLRISRAASVVVVGQPNVADVQIESPRLVFVLGKAVGETNLLILDGDGNEVGSYEILVVPEADRHVTIFHGGDGVSTLSCNPRCAGVRNPGTEKEPKGSGGGAPAGGGLPGLGSPSGGGAPPAPAPTAAATQTQGGAPQPSLAPGATVEQGAGTSAGNRGY